MRATTAIHSAAINDPKRAQDWLSTGRTYAEQRYSPLLQITVANARSLGLAWSLDLPSKGTLEATPLVANGIIYTTGSWGVVFAVDGRSGQLLWSYDPHAQLRSAEAIVWDRNRGLALYDGKVFVAVADGRLIALDAASGEEVWTSQTFDRKTAYAITGAPRVYDGVVVIGMNGADIGTRGYASAYDAKTGKPMWRFYAVPGNPANGFESKAMEMAAKTWKGEWWKYGGGGNPWNALAYDSKLHLAYIAFANGGPWTQSLRSPGGGDNLFLASIVAVNIDTGAYVWHYQNTPGEEWDYDATMDMILADIKVDKKLRHVLMQANKNGFFYVLDRQTGEFLSAKNFVRVTWTDGIDSGGRPLPKAGVHFEQGAVEIAPDWAGGHNWYPMSFSPKTNLSYFSWRENSAILSKVNSLDSAPAQRGALDMPKVAPSFAPPTGGILGWDPSSQREAWRMTLPSQLVGGTAVTAGNVVFAGTGDGRLLALDAVSGRSLWEGATNNAVMGGPSVYSIDGVEYVTVMAGIGGVFSLEAGLQAYGYRYGMGRRLLAFRLGGKAALPSMNPVTPEPVPSLTSSDPQVLRGEALYLSRCANCHGFSGRNAGGAPELRRSRLINSLSAVLLEGALVPNGMPSFKRLLSTTDVEDLQAYLHERAVAGP